MVDAGVGALVDPDRVGKSVAIAGYSLDIGSSPGMAISTLPDPGGNAAEQRSRLSHAIVQGNKDEKQRRGIVEGVELASERAEALTDQFERADKLWTEVVAGTLEVSAVNGEIDTLLVLLQKLDRSGRFDEQLRLARSLSRLLAVALRWIDLLRSLREVLAAAERHGDPQAKAWALHELGTLHLAAGNMVDADQALSRASELRRELGDTRGLAATERNLQVLCRRLRQLMREGRLVERRGVRKVLHVSNVVLAIILLVAFGGATAAVAASALLGGGGHHAVVANVRGISPGSGPTRGGTTVAPSLPPSVSGVLPATGPASGGTRVTITGTGLAKASEVAFASTPATHLHVRSATMLTAISPRGSGTVDVTVVTPAGTSSRGSADRFVYAPLVIAPTVTGLSPPSGDPLGGQLVKVSGSGLANASAVLFGGTEGTHLQNGGDTTLTVLSPQGSGTVDVTVLTPVGKSVPNSAARFAYSAPGVAPTVTRVSPSTADAAVGGIVKITGTGLAKTRTVTFGSSSTQDFTIMSDTELAVTIPPAPASGGCLVDVTVTTPAGSSALSPADEFDYSQCAG